MIAARPLRAHAAKLLRSLELVGLLPDLDPLVSQLRFELAALRRARRGLPSVQHAGS